MTCYKRVHSKCMFCGIWSLFANPVTFILYMYACLAKSRFGRIWKFSLWWGIGQVLSWFYKVSGTYFLCISQCIGYNWHALMLISQKYKKKAWRSEGQGVLNACAIVKLSLKGKGNTGKSAHENEPWRHCPHLHPQCRLPVRVRGGTTLEVVPPWTQTVGRWRKHGQCPSGPCLRVIVPV